MNKSPEVNLFFFFFLIEVKMKPNLMNEVLRLMFSRQIEELKESYQEKMENTFEMYKDAIKEHAYQSAMNNLEDDYVPLDEFIAEQEKVEVGLLISCLSGS